MSIPITGIGISGATNGTIAYLGSTIQLSPVFTPSNTTDTYAEWWSGSSDITFLNNSGLIRIDSAVNRDARIFLFGSNGLVATLDLIITNYVSDVSVSGTAPFYAGDTRTLSAVVSPWNANIKDVTWSSSNPSVATVDSNGTVTGISGGTSIITATSVLNTNKSGSYTVTILSSTRVTSISSISGPSSVDLNATITLSASVYPENSTTKTISWSSDTPGVATVNSSGVVTGISVGTATITATTTDGGFTSTKSITVNTPVTTVTGLTTSPLLSNPDTITINGNPHIRIFYNYYNGLPTPFPLDIQATGTNVSNAQLTYTVGNPSVVSVDSSGVLTVVPNYSVGSGEYTLTTVTVTSVNNPSVNATYYLRVQNALFDVVAIRSTLPYGYLGIDQGSVQPITLWNEVNNYQIQNGFTDIANLVWTVSDPSILSINTSSPEAPTIRGLLNGTAVITAYYNNTVSNYTVIVANTIVSATGISSISGYSTVNIGSTISLLPNFTPSNTTNQTVTWSSSATGVATVNSAGVVTGISSGTATITVTSQDGGFTATKDINVIQTVTSISSISGSSTVVAGSTITLSASVSPANATNQTITWSSDATEVATVNSSGVVTGVAAGSATITARSSDGGFTSTLTITVTQPVTSISSISGASSVTVGSTITLSASVSPANATNQTITWSSSATGVATVNSSGIVTGVAAGSATITATTADGGFTATKNITVSNVVVSVSSISSISGSSTVVAGSTITLSASVSPANATNQTITWSSSATGVATVNSSGVVTGVAAGSATITATTADGGFTATKSITVTQPVTSISSISGSSTVAAGSTITLSASVSPANATNKTITWSSSATGVATVNSSGVVTGVAAGSATITATTADGGFTATKSIIVTQPVTSISSISGSSTVVAGSTITLSASVSPANATNQIITWSSDATGVATVNSSGVVTGVAAGSATITATTADGGFTATKSITVTAIETVAVTGISSVTFQLSFRRLTNINDGLAAEAYVLPLNATNQSISWTSSNTSVITINSSTGQMLARGYGSTTITATSVDGNFSNSATFYVGPAVTGISAISGLSSVNTGSSITLSASVTPSDAPIKIINWSSSNTSIATVNSSGVVTGIAAGSATITATTDEGGYSSTKSITVTKPVSGISSISGSSSVEVGSTITLSASVSPADATNQTITWSSDATGVATVNSSGVVTGVAAGSATITATTADGGFTSTKSISVSNAVVSVSSISSISGSSTVAAGSTITLSASVSPANATNQTITWSSDATGVATVNSSGVVTGVAAGSATITATTADGGFSSTKTITVTQSVTSISSISGSSFVNVGSTITLSASVSPSDATDKTITWSSDASGVATVNSSGVVTGVAGGTATITAAAGGFSSTKSITVVVPVTGISSISGASSVEVGSTISLSASVSPLNATNQVIVWSSDASGVAIVDASGVVTGVAIGSATITATTLDGTYTATKSISVSEYTIDVSGITSITGSGSTLVLGATMQLSASVTPSDAANQSITWTSSNDGIAIVDASGLVTADSINTGLVTITATTADGGFIATYDITVTLPPLTNLVITYDGDVSDYSSFFAYSGTQLQFYASPIPSNAAMPLGVIWSSSDESVATVDSNGLVSFLAAGTVKIYAESADDSSIVPSSNGTVQQMASDFTVTTSSGYNVLRIGGTLQLTPVLTPSNAVATFYWTSTNGNAIINSGTGLVTCVSTTPNTQAVINVTMYSGTNTIQKQILLYIGEEFTGFSFPTLNILDTTNSGEFINGSDNININRTQTVEITNEVPNGEGASSDITYSSSNTAVLTKQIDKNGNEAPYTFNVVGTGTTIITASVYEQTLTKSITVVDETFVPITGFEVSTQGGASTEISYGSTIQLTATPVPSNASYTVPRWYLVSTTSDGASVDLYTGVVTAGSTDGTIVVKAQFTNSVYQEFTVTVGAPTTPVTGISAISAAGELTYVAPGSTLALSASVSPANAGNKTINWSSSNTSLATVDASGVVTGVALGNVTITATAAGNTEYTSTYALRIGVPVTGINGISGASSVIAGQTTQLTSGVTPSNASVQGITWSSSNPAAATVASSGLVTGVDGGETTITATTVEGAHFTTFNMSVIVLPTDVTGISDPSGNTRFIDIPRGGTRQLSGVYVPTNTTNKSMTWESSNTSIATIDASGVITGVAKGSCGIRGRSVVNPNFTSTATITVYIPVTGMNPITHSAASDQVTLGAALQLSCAGVIPSDADNKTYTWSSSHPTHVVISSRGYLGVLSSMPDNEFTITVTSADGGFTATKTFTIYRPLAGVGQITAPLRAVAVGLNNTLQLTMPLLPANATTKTITWTSSNPSKISIDASGVCSGLALTARKETITITASITEPTTNVTYTRTYPLTCPIILIKALSAVTIYDSNNSIYTSGTLVRGNSYRFATAINPGDASYRAQGITWSVNDTANASIDASGNLTITGYPKTLKVTATTVSSAPRKSASRSLKVVVMPSGFQSPVETNTGSLITNPKKTVILKPVLLPLATTNRKLTYVSSDPTIATVSTSGTVKGVRAGTVTITMTSQANPSISTTAQITVV